MPMLPFWVVCLPQYSGSTVMLAQLCPRFPTARFANLTFKLEPWRERSRSYSHTACRNSMCRMQLRQRVTSNAPNATRTSNGAVLTICTLQQQHMCQLRNERWQFGRSREAVQAAELAQCRVAFRKQCWKRCVHLPNNGTRQSADYSAHALLLLPDCYRHLSML